MVQCGNKYKFSGKQHAENRLKELQSQGKATEKTIYHCKICLKWHIGLNQIYMSMN